MDQDELNGTFDRRVRQLQSPDEEYGFELEEKYNDVHLERLELDWALASGETRKIERQINKINFAISQLVSALRKNPPDDIIYMVHNLVILIAQDVKYCGEIGEIRPVFAESQAIGFRKHRRNTLKNFSSAVST